MGRLISTRVVGRFRQAAINILIVVAGFSCRLLEKTAPVAPREQSANRGDRSGGFTRPHSVTDAVVRASCRQDTAWAFVDVVISDKKQSILDKYAFDRVKWLDDLVCIQTFATCHAR